MSSDLEAFLKLCCLGSVDTNKNWVELAELFLNSEDVETFKTFLAPTGITIFRDEQPKEVPYWHYYF